MVTDVKMKLSTTLSQMVLQKQNPGVCISYKCLAICLRICNVITNLARHFVSGLIISNRDASKFFVHSYHDDA